MKVLAADDHWIAREALKHLLKGLAHNVEVYEAESFAEALSVVENHSDLDLVLVDLMMPGLEPLQGLRALRTKVPHVPVVVISVNEERQNVLRALDLGVMGYIPKTSKGPVILKALEHVLSGEVYLPRGLLDQADTASVQEDTWSSQQIDDADLGLTRRQAQILELLGRGKTNSQIAEQLGLSVNTVRVHIHSLLKRLQLDNRTQAVLFAASRDRLRGSPAAWQRAAV